MERSSPKSDTYMMITIQYIPLFLVNIGSVQLLLLDHFQFLQNVCENGKFDAVVMIVANTFVDLRITFFFCWKKAKHKIQFTNIEMIISACLC